MTERVAIIVAGGSSRRMGGIDKLWHPILGRPLLAYTIDVFETSVETTAIVLVAGKNGLSDARALCEKERWSKVAAIVAGGERRRDSVRSGLSAVERVAPRCEVVLVHDGARPLATHALITAGLGALATSGAAIPVLPVSDAVKEVDEGAVVGSPDRARLAFAQTPQVFRLELLLRAHAAGPDADAADDSMLVERLGERVVTFPGSPSNLKVTTPEDLLLAEAWIRRGTPA